MTFFDSYSFDNIPKRNEILRKIKGLSQEDIMDLLNALACEKIKLSDVEGIVLEIDKNLKKQAKNILKYLKNNKDVSFDYVDDRLSKVLTIKDIDNLLKKLYTLRKTEEGIKSELEDISILPTKIDDGELPLDISSEEVSPLLSEQELGNSIIKGLNVDCKIFDTGEHVVLTKGIPYGVHKDNYSQIIIPDGYKLTTLNKNEDYAVFENKVPVMVKIYQNMDGEKNSPMFGTPMI